MSDRAARGVTPLYILVFLEPPALLRSPKVVSATAAHAKGVAITPTITPKGIVGKGPIHASPKEPPRSIVPTAPTLGWSAPKRPKVTPLGTASASSLGSSAAAPLGVEGVAPSAPEEPARPLLLHVIEHGVEFLGLHEEGVLLQKVQ